MLLRGTSYRFAIKFETRRGEFNRRVDCEAAKHKRLFSAGVARFPFSRFCFPYNAFRFTRSHVSLC